VLAERKDRIGSFAGGVFQRQHRHVVLVGLQAGEFIFGSGVGHNAARRLGRCGCIEACLGIEQSHGGSGNGPAGLVGERSANAEEFLRITGVRTAEGHVLLDGDVHGQHRAGLGDDDAVGGFVRALQGDVWILRRRAAAYGEGEGKKSEFHGLEVFIH